MKWILLASLSLLLISGCKFSPLSPELQNRIDNQNGKIDDIKSNQNGLMLDMLKLENKQDVTARDIKNMQSGLVNQTNENSGLQIFQGDGGIIAGIGVIAIVLIVAGYYRGEAVKNKKTAEILAQQIALHDDLNLNNEVFLAALNSDVEENVYHVMVNSQIKDRNRNPVE